MKYILKSCALIIAFCASTFAQRMEEEVIIPQNIRATTLEERPLSETLYYLDTEQAYQPFEIGQKRRGQANVQPLSKKLVLYRKGADEEGNTIYNPVINVNIPEVGNVLVVFYWDKNEKIGYMALDDTRETHPSQFARIVNIADGTAKVQVSNNSNILSVAPSETAITQNPIISSDSSYFNFAYALSNQTGSRSKPPINRWRMASKDQRLLVFITYGYYTEELDGEIIRTRMPQLVTMFDFPPDPPASI